MKYSWLDWRNIRIKLLKYTVNLRKITLPASPERQFNLGQPENTNFVDTKLSLWYTEDGDLSSVFLFFAWLPFYTQALLLPQDRSAGRASSIIFSPDHKETGRALRLSLLLT